MDHHDDRPGAQEGGLSHDLARPGEGDTERVEDYLALEEHLKQLQANRRPRRPRRLSPSEARIYQTAALFRAAHPGAAEPDPAFAADLRARLEQEIKHKGRSPALPGFSRRNLLTGGLGVAAAAAGVALGVGVDRVAVNGGQMPWHTDLVPSGVWQPVALVDAVPLGGVVRFTTDSLVGYVRHTPQGFVALSASCTHMGCLVNWNGAARTFDCPCHGGRFLETGQAAPSSPVAYRPLPTIHTKTENGQIFVFVPAASGGPAPDWSGSGDDGGYHRGS